jgi:hypothetical protein
MQKQTIVFCAAAVPLALAVAAGLPNSTAPGSRIQVLSHNAYPDHGKYADRLDRTLSAGLPVAIEEDLAWIDGRSLLIHGAKNATAEDPTLESYFFPKVKPIMEKALKEGNKGNWPLITLYLDIKNDPPEHLAVIDKMLDKYDAWLTKAAKTADINKVSPLELKPMMVIVEDKQGDVKQQFFYDNVPAGGRIRVFGSAEKFDENPQKLPRERKEEAVAMMASRDPEQLLTKKADNYRRWVGVNWEFIEKGGQTHSGEWTKESEARMKKFVDYGHRLGYLVSLYCLDGFTAADNQGWDLPYNFGSKEKATARWQAAARAHADFISTDQMEDVAAVIKSTR